MKAGNRKCNLCPRGDVLTKRNTSQQDKAQEGIYTALEICDEFPTESNLMLRLIFFFNSGLKAYYNTTYQYGMLIHALN